MSDLEEKLGYRFQDQDLLIQSVTHPSIAAEQRSVTCDNQRLEFLGDAVLDLVVAEELFHHDEELSEGPMTELKASVVSRGLRMRGKAPIERSESEPWKTMSKGRIDSRLRTTP